MGSINIHDSKIRRKQLRSFLFLRAQFKLANFSRVKRRGFFSENQAQQIPNFTSRMIRQSKDESAGALDESKHLVGSLFPEGTQVWSTPGICFIGYFVLSLSPHSTYGLIWAVCRQYWHSDGPDNWLLDEPAEQKCSCIFVCCKQQVIPNTYTTQEWNWWDNGMSWIFDIFKPTKTCRLRKKTISAVHEISASSLCTVWLRN